MFGIDEGPEPPTPGADENVDGEAPGMRGVLIDERGTLSPLDDDDDDDWKRKVDDSKGAT